LKMAEPTSTPARDRNESRSDVFRASTAHSQQGNLTSDLAQLVQLAPDMSRKATEEQLLGFQQLFSQFTAEKGGLIDWSLIKPPPEEMIAMHANLAEPTADELAGEMQKLAVLKLNGGLGTGMGCKGPKSVIQVRNDLSFLDLTVMQIEHLNTEHSTDVPLVLMNSFNTDTDTELILRKYEGCNATIKRFNQSQYPRLLRDSMQPAPKNFDDKNAWYPPGHGDLYRSLVRSGMLDELIAAGKEYLFVSNIDNLGSVVDSKILHKFATDDGCEFIMEVTDKTRADVKGGTLIEYEGGCRLLEIAQVAKENVNEFKSVNKFRIFNTNNLWIKLSAIKRLHLAEELHMEVIENKKEMGGVAVIQLEQAVGSAIKNFKGAMGVNVPRSRFLPVKQCQDLLLVMSDLFQQSNGVLTMSEKRVFKHLPLIKLGKEFKKVGDFLSRFETVPNVLELDHLTVSGNVTFGRNVTLKGTVIIIANEGERIEIPPCSLLENKIVTGNLRILDH